MNDQKVLDEVARAAGNALQEYGIIIKLIESHGGIKRISEDWLSECSSKQNRIGEAITEDIRHHKKHFAKIALKSPAQQQIITELKNKHLTKEDDLKDILHWALRELKKTVDDINSPIGRKDMYHCYGRAETPLKIIYLVAIRLGAKTKHGHEIDW